MRKILLTILSLVCVLSSYAIILDGKEYTIDTLSMYPAGPGTTFYELRMLRADNGGNRLDCWLLAIDTQNPYVSVEQVMGTGQITGTETPSNMAKRSSTDTKIFFAGSNGDFFLTKDDDSTADYKEIGMPAGTTIVNNEYALTPWGAGGGRRAGGMDADGKGVTGYTHELSMQVITPEGTTLNINHANYTRLENELVLYNHHNGATTKTNAYGTEVKIELLAGEKWQTTGTMKAKVLDKQTNVGSMALASSYAVLSGHGTMAAELEKLNVGDELTLNFQMKLDGEIVNVAQLIGGDHYSAMILEDGKIAQSGYWDELHPRTGFGVSQTRDTVFMLVVDGRGISYGCNTKVLAEILKHYGAYNAVNWDGGGSSCIYVRPFDQMNNGSDGQERACGNGMFAVANVPQVDETIATIKPYMPIYSLPRYGLAQPKFLGYNQYGVLVNTDVQDVKLSCDPALGEILEDGRFLASGEKGGVLTATWGNLTTELDVRIVASAPVAIRLDTMLLGPESYAVEVQGTVGNNTLPLLSSALTWTTSNPAVATVNELGEVKAVANGTVVITGILGDFTDSLVVNVELPTANQMVWDDFRQTDTWEVKGGTGMKPALSVPEDASTPVSITFTKGSRNPFVQVSKDSVIYSVPEKIRIPYTTSAIIDKVTLILRANNSTTAQQINFVENLKTGEETVLEFNLKDVFGTDMAVYPLHFVTLKFIPTKDSAAGQHYITSPGIIEVFGENDETALDNTVVNDVINSKYIENGALYIQSNNATYNILGAQVK